MDYKKTQTPPDSIDQAVFALFQIGQASCFRIHSYRGDRECGRGRI
jgi:hypothetical protein